MPTVSFTSALRRFVETPEAAIEGATVGAVLAAVFAEHPALRGYVLDDQGALRRHVNIYINGEPLRDRARLADPVGGSDRIYVVQALTGG